MSAQTENLQEVRQLVDWSAALWAGLVAGFVFLLLYLVIAPLVLAGDALVFIRYLASIILGPEAILAQMNPLIIILALVVHFALSIIWTLIVTSIIHRWGLIIGILLGGLLGLAIYGINFFSFIFLFPWFWTLSSAFMAVAHVIFGAVAGGVYEYLEVERYVAID